MTFDIEQIINNHQISLVPGVPDYRAIRKIEQEIHGEPLTPYPGEWDEISRVYHHKIHLRYTSMYISGCLWCEDRRQDREWAKAEMEVEAKRRKPRYWNPWNDPNHLEWSGLKFASVFVGTIVLGSSVLLALVLLPFWLTGSL
jgi:hypothetical protein